MTSPALSVHTGQITKEVIRRVAEFTGRGPVSGRTEIGNDSITVLLEGVLTKGERNLVDHDHTGAVETNREAVQDALGDSLIEAVESITNRKVRGLLSASDVELDISVEVFVLEPEAPAA